MNISELNFTSLTQDSRKAEPGVLYFAVEGTSSDGHRFVEQAIASGAIAAVIRKDHPLASQLFATGKCIAVEDVRSTLGQTSAAFYGNPSDRLLVCGVTGTNGKTTSTYLLEAIFQEWEKKPAVIGTVENRFESRRIESTHTTPDAIGLQKLFSDFLKMGAGSICMEVSSHALDQKRVVGTQFAAVLFTNLTQDHLDYHRTMENYFAAKVSLFTDYPVRMRAIHTGDAYGKRLAEICRAKNLKMVTFAAQDADIEYGSLTFDLSGIRGKLGGISVQSRLFGAFNIQNIAGAVATAVGLGVPDDVIARAIQKSQAVPGRLERVENSKNLTVVVDYAHTPDALENVLKTLRPICKGKLVCLFGCGGDRDSTKRPIMGEIAQRLSDHIIVTSDNPRTEKPETIIADILKGISKDKTVSVIEDRAEAIAHGVKLIDEDDILLIAGKGHEDYQIIGTCKIHFDDRETARGLIKS